MSKKTKKAGNIQHVVDTKYWAIYTDRFWETIAADSYAGARRAFRAKYPTAPITRVVFATADQVAQGRGYGQFDFQQTK